MLRTQGNMKKRNIRRGPNEGVEKEAGEGVIELVALRAKSKLSKGVT